MTQITVFYLTKQRKLIENFSKLQEDSPLELVELSGQESEQEIIDYICQSPSDLYYFYYEGYLYAQGMLGVMAAYLDKVGVDVDLAVAAYSFLDTKNRIMSPSYFSLSDGMDCLIVSGLELLKIIEKTGVTVFGDVGMFMLRKEYLLRMLQECTVFDILKGKSVLGEQSRCVYIGESLAGKYLKSGNEEIIKKSYEEWSITKEKGLVDFPVRKEITFFYTDKGEYYNLKPIGDYAMLNRGYKVKYTQDIKEQAEIGVYCQHVCYPENSKFSLILLHDMAQGHNRWPNIWHAEHWNGFDIGILPGSMWADLWKQSGEFYYSNPRRGVYTFGYPKSDICFSEEQKSRVEAIKKELHLKYSYSVLYAPSWENDEKEDDFVRALASLPVNLLIKQAQWPENYQFVIDNINYMRQLHEGKYENVYYIDPSESILTALEICDLVVSDESSVMSEALMFNKPSLAVVDWTIPDTVPPRLASVPMEYVMRCKKVELRECVEKLYGGKNDFEDILKKGQGLFVNKGKSCQLIMDAIDYYLGYSEDKSFMDNRIIPDFLPCY